MGKEAIPLGREIEEILEWRLLPDDVHDVVDIDLTVARVDEPYIFPIPMRSLSVIRADDDFSFKVDSVGAKSVPVRRGTTPVWKDRIFRVIFVSNSASTVAGARATILACGRTPTPAVYKYMPPIPVIKVPQPKFVEVSSL